MIRFRPESHGFLLFLSFLLVGVVSLAGPAAGAQPLHPVFAPHEDTEIGEGGPTGAAADADTTALTAGDILALNVDYL